MEVHGATQSRGLMFVSFVEAFKQFGAADSGWFAAHHRSCFRCGILDFFV